MEFNETVFQPITTSSSVQLWNREKILGLIGTMEEFFEDFYDKKQKKKNIWNKVAEHMRQKGFICTGLSCEKKWRDLKNHYAHTLQNELRADKNFTFEYFGELHHILGQEVEPDKNQSDNEDDIASNASEPARVDDLAEEGQEDNEVASSPGRSEELPSQTTNEKDDETLESKVKIEKLTSTSAEKQQKKSSNELPQRALKNTIDKASLKDTLRSMRDKTLLKRVRYMESFFSLKRRVDRHEAKVEALQQQRKVTRETNALLAQALKEMQRINTELKQGRGFGTIRDESTPSIQVIPIHDKVCYSPTKPEIVLVETSSDY